MRIISPTWELLKPENSSAGVDCLRYIEQMARISHRTEDRQTLDSWERFIQNVVVDHGDWSVVEHASATVILRVNRGVTHEQVRHRLFAYTQESTRFVNYSKDSTTAEYIPSVRVLPEHFDEWVEDLTKTDAIYLKWLKRGYAPQIARDHLPNALASTISITGNLRNWRHFLIMRTSKETHPDFRRVTVPLLKEFQERIPIIFDDIAPESKQSEAQRSAR
jgi:thymidylate synthase (FAD)